MIFCALLFMNVIVLILMCFCRLKEEGANPDEVKTPKKRGPKPKIKLDENGMPIEPKPKR